MVHLPLVARCTGAGSHLNAGLLCTVSGYMLCIEALRGARETVCIVTGADRGMHVTWGYSSPVVGGTVSVGIKFICAKFDWKFAFDESRPAVSVSGHIPDLSLSCSPKVGVTLNDTSFGRGRGAMNFGCGIWQPAMFLDAFLLDKTASTAELSGCAGLVRVGFGFSSDKILLSMKCCS